MMEHAAAFKVLREDFDRLDAEHWKGCVRCSPAHVCGYALGIAAAYRAMESRLSPTREPFPPNRESLRNVSEDERMTDEPKPRVTVELGDTIFITPDRFTIEPIPSHPTVVNARPIREKKEPEESEIGGERARVFTPIARVCACATSSRKSFLTAS